MLLIPLGLILVFFYINVYVGDFVVDLLPDAVGYLLIAANAWKFKEKSYSFSYLVPLGVVLAVYSAAVRLILPTGMAGVAASLVELVMQLYLLKFIVRGIEDLGWTIGAHLNTDILNRWRLWVSGAWAAVFVCATFGTLAPDVAIFGLAAVAVWAVMCILFLVTLFRTNHRYKMLLRFGTPKPRRPEEEDSEAEEDD